MKTLINIILIGIIFCFFGCQTKTYEGAKLSGKPHGMGVLYTNGEKVFEGEFKDGNIYEGTMYKSNGGKIVGIFKNDAPWDAKEMCPVGSHLANYENGEKLLVNN